MNKRYGWIIVTYIAMQLSGAIGLPLLIKTGWYNQYEREAKLQIASGHWAIISFLTALLIILWLFEKKTGGRLAQMAKKNQMRLQQSFG
ncbi:hypothetical protein GCM10020331_016300 [Ectobacillus funiculus]